MHGQRNQFHEAPIAIWHRIYRVKKWQIFVLFPLFSALTASAQNRQSKPAPARRSFSVVDATVPQMQAAMRAARVTSRDLVLQYLTRIATSENKLEPAIPGTPNAL